MNEILKELENEKYINLETYRKNGKTVHTPVWFVISDDLIQVITREKTGKVNRLKNNPKVKFAKCGFKGELKGDWHSGVSKFFDDDQVQKILKLRKKKYGFFSTFIAALSKSKGDYVGFSITPEQL